MIEISQVKPFMVTSVRLSLFFFRASLMISISFSVNVYLPEIIISIEKSFSSAELNGKQFLRLISNRDYKFILDLIITEALVEHTGAIKRDDDLSNAYERLLELLTKFNYEKAAVILDSYRVN